MVGLLLFKEQIFFDRGNITLGGEALVLVGFVSVAIFDVTTVVWMLARLRRASSASTADYLTVGLGILCTVLLVGEKVMIDEIGREYLRMAGYRRMDHFIYVSFDPATI